MAGAVAVYAVTSRSIRHRSKPLFASSFSWPTQRRIELKLVVGAAIFGIGWGIAGYCPGPAIASLGTGAGQAFIFVAAMLVGSYVGKLLEARVFPSRHEPAPGA